MTDKCSRCGKKKHADYSICPACAEKLLHGNTCSEERNCAILLAQLENDSGFLEEELTDDQWSKESHLRFLGRVQEIINTNEITLQHLEYILVDLNEFVSMLSTVEHDNLALSLLLNGLCRRGKIS